MLKGQELKEIIQLIDESSISEFVYETNESAVTIKKNSNHVQSVNMQETIETKLTPAIEEQVVTAQPEVKEVKETASVEVADDSITEILSPMVGTFYRRPSPESDAYVEVGSNINEDATVCIVEAMKLFNEIEAEVNGEVVEILVGDGELVEFGQPLFKVKTK